MPQQQIEITKTPITRPVRVTKVGADGSVASTVTENRAYTLVEARVRRRLPDSVRAVVLDANSKPLSKWFRLLPDPQRRQYFRGLLPGVGVVKVQASYRMQLEASR